VVRFCGFFLLSAAAAVLARAEDITPRVGIVQIFGLQKASGQKIESSLGVKPGDLLPSRDATEERLAKLPGIVASSVQAVCCSGSNMILYIGIEEKGAAHLNFHAEPAADLTLPQEVIDKYNRILHETEASLRGRNADEDLTNGYSLLADAEGREQQEEMIPLVAEHLAVIDQVVRTSNDPEQRAIAAYILQYAPRTPRESKIMTDALQYALQDPDQEVRAKALTSLKAVLVGAKMHREQHIHIEPTWFVELMNSLEWSDRRDASLALVALTEKRDPDTLALLRERALNSVVDMAQWQDLQHALPGFILAGRMAGLGEKEIQDAWVSGQREPVLKELRKKH
jgi:hypothetical protein